MGSLFEGGGGAQSTWDHYCCVVDKETESQKDKVAALRLVANHDRR